MRIPRSFLKDATTTQHFHLISRVVDKAFKLDEGSKEKFVMYLDQHERFSGCKVISFIVLDNHFHLLVRIPPKPEMIPEEEVLRRASHIMTARKHSDLIDQIEELRSNDCHEAAEGILNGYRKRMFDLSMFMKDLKQRFTQWYNFENKRKGTLWESRFKSIVVDACPKTMRKLSLYIDLNAVRAGIVSDPKEYKWNGFSRSRSQSHEGGGSTKRGRGKKDTKLRKEKVKENEKSDPGESGFPAEVLGCSIEEYARILDDLVEAYHLSQPKEGNEDMSKQGRGIKMKEEPPGSSNESKSRSRSEAVSILLQFFRQNPRYSGGHRICMEKN